MQLKFNWIYVSILLVSCSSHTENKATVKDDTKKDTLVAQDSLPNDTVKKEINKIDTLEQRIIDLGLQNIQEVDSTIQVDLKYATTDNFMKMNMYGDLKNAYLQPEMAERLAKAQEYLKSVDSNLSLLVYDAVRPKFVQQMMWDSIDKPFAEKIKFVSNPKNGSIHNYGAAIDLTIINTETGEVLDMGAGYDDPRKIAYPRLEKTFLETGELTKKQYQNRKLLRAAMAKGNFWVLSTEWWHFNGCSRATAKSKYPVLQ